MGSADEVRVRLHGNNAATARSKADYVLYWMQMYRRADDNAALAYAIREANARGLPCLVYEALRPDYPFASDRFHTFVLEGACDVALGLAARGVKHVFFLPKTRDEARGVLAKLAARAALVVTDMYPSFLIPEQTAGLAKRIDCPVVSIDDCAAVPLALFPKEEIGARTLRPKMTRVLDDWLVPLEEPTARIAAPKRLDLPFEPTKLTHAAIPALVAACAIDHTVPPVLESKGGTTVAMTRAESFVRKKLGTYGTDRNDPSRTGTSALSPYLHFGMISARKVALLARESASETSTREEGGAAFLEQLLVRRGLAYNFADKNPLHRDYAAIPPWAKKTLSEHASDKRPWLGTLDDLTHAKTPDALWNAAQNELLSRGVIHGYARMLWGKLPLTWMQDPKSVHAALVHLNDRFALDGRDPDGYASISWCFGLHDRPWPSRAIYGAVRCMTSKSARQKLDFEGYIERWSNGSAGGGRTLTLFD